MTEVIAIPQQQKYINPRAYPIVILDGKGGKQVVAPGEVVEGSQYQKYVDARKGLLPFNGPREIGPMQKVGLNPQTAMTPHKFVKNLDNVPGIAAPRVDGAIPTDKLSGATMGERYLGKTPAEWSTVPLDGFTRGQLIGLVNYLGLDVPSTASKNDVMTILTSRLAQYKQG